MKSPKTVNCNIFLICGADTGSNIMRFLVKNGYNVIVGILHKNDIDYIVGKTMELKIIGEEPYNPISQKNYELALNKIKSCDIVIYTDFPIGEINRLNKKLIEESINLNKYVIKYEGSIEGLKEKLNKCIK